MKTLLLLCTAVTVLQVFDAITGTSALSATPSKPFNGIDYLYKNAESGKTNIYGQKPAVRSAPRAVTKPNNEKANIKPKVSPKPMDDAPAINPNDDDDSEETEPPKTIKESGKRAIKTFKKLANKHGAGVLNGLTGLMKSASGTLQFFGKFIRNRSNNVKDVAKGGFGLLSDLGDSTSKGTRHLLNSARVIGSQGADSMYSTLQKATGLGKNLTKLGGNVVDIPISIGKTAVGAANGIFKFPNNLTKFANIAGTLKPNSDESETEEEKEPPKRVVPRSPSPIKRIQTKTPTT